MPLRLSIAALNLALLFAPRLAIAAEKAAEPYAKEGNITPRIEKLTPKQESKILGDVKVADGFEATLFAAPPAVNYPVFVAAAPDGTLYVSSDGNGSLGRNPHRGCVIRLRDTDNDGRADETICDIAAAASSASGPTAPALKSTPPARATFWRWPSARSWTFSRATTPTCASTISPVSTTTAIPACSDGGCPKVVITLRVMSPVHRNLQPPHPLQSLHSSPGATL
jgi:hypothetical protein